MLMPLVPLWFIAELVSWTAPPVPETCTPFPMFFTGGHVVHSSDALAAPLGLTPIPNEFLKIRTLVAGGIHRSTCRRKLKAAPLLVRVVLMIATRLTLVEGAILMPFALNP